MSYIRPWASPSGSGRVRRRRPCVVASAVRERGRVLPVVRDTGHHLSLVHTLGAYISPVLATECFAGGITLARQTHDYPDHALTAIAGLV